mmetsp:Transcript_68570/g.155091  ORF Transcript_68570/g.155091 Transcript_68570/m.155091 type:complete len:243 (+) Transcript_68570:1140-1868(+)
MRCWRLVSETACSLGVMTSCGWRLPSGVVSSRSILAWDNRRASTDQPPESSANLGLRWAAPNARSTFSRKTWMAVLGGGGRWMGSSGLRGGAFRRRVKPRARRAFEVPSAGKWGHSVAVLAWMMLASWPKCLEGAASTSPEPAVSRPHRECFRWAYCVRRTASVGVTSLPRSLKRTRPVSASNKKANPSCRDAPLSSSATQLSPRSSSRSAASSSTANGSDKWAAGSRAAAGGAGEAGALSR